MGELCPNCGTRTVNKLKCVKCHGDFHTGSLVLRASKEKSVSLPSVREAIPKWLSKSLRDGGAKRQKCGVRRHRRIVL